MRTPFIWTWPVPFRLAALFFNPRRQSQTDEPFKILAAVKGPPFPGRKAARGLTFSPSFLAEHYPHSQARACRTDPRNANPSKNTCVLSFFFFVIYQSLPARHHPHLTARAFFRGFSAARGLSVTRCLQPVPLPPFLDPFLPFLMNLLRAVLDFLAGDRPEKMPS